MNRSNFTKRLPFFVLLSAALLVAGCSGMPGSPGYISKSTSEFDGAQTMRMEPAWVDQGPVKLALGWHSRMPDGKLFLVASVEGAHTFAGGESLRFRIGDQFVGFQALDDGGGDIELSEGVSYPGGYLPAQNWTSNTYLVDRSFVERLVDAEESYVRVRLRDGLAEGEFSTGMPTQARPAFRDFLAEMEAME